MTVQENKTGYADLPMTDKINTEYNSLTLSQMEVGTKIEGVLKAVDPEGSPYGATLILTMENGTDLTVFPCGNIKRFVVPEVVSGERPTGSLVRFSRKRDKTFKTRTGKSVTTSDFAVFHEGYTPPRFREDNTAANKPAAKTTESKTNLEDVKKALS